MKNFFTAFIVFMIWSLFGLWIYSWIQPIDLAAKAEKTYQLKEDIPIVEQKEEMILDSILKTSMINEVPIIEVKDSIVSTPKGEKLDFKATNMQDDIIFLYNDGVKIIKNKLEVIIPEESKDYKYKINSYLLEHPKQEVHLYTVYSPQEKVLNPNIGIKRADKIEKELVKVGVPIEKIVKKSIIKNNIFSTDSIFSNGFYFTFELLDNERINSIKAKIPEKRIVYPKFTGSGVAVNNELKLLLNDLKEYFKENPNKKVDIVGHTDNIGNSSDNYSIGLKYAQQVRWYLINKGNINKTSIKALSKGESEPLDSNNNNQGRNYNRRIEVIFR